MLRFDDSHASTSRLCTKRRQVRAPCTNVGSSGGDGGNPRPPPHRPAARRRPSSSTTCRCGSCPASGGCSSAPTAAARRRCSGSPRCTTTPPRGPSTCSASGSAAPTSASCAATSATPRPPSPTSCARRCAVLDVVRTARYAALEPWWHRYTRRGRRPGAACLDRMGVGRFAERPFESLSSGERQRVLLARTLMNDPAVVLLDEPSARARPRRPRAARARPRRPRRRSGGAALGRRHPPRRRHPADDRPTPCCWPTDGRSPAVRSTTVLDSANLSACFGLDLVLERRPDGRFSAWARR